MFESNMMILLLSGLATLYFGYYAFQAWFHFDKLGDSLIRRNQKQLSNLLPWQSSEFRWMKSGVYAWYLRILLTVGFLAMGTIFFLSIFVLFLFP